MEENVALDSTKQRKFIKSIKGIKKLIKKNEVKSEIQKEVKKVEVKQKEDVKPAKPFSMKLKKTGRLNKKQRRNPRGLVYLSHIPHGFYEHQMVQYFKQFGVVTNARVIRSKRTGNSKGYAFVEFKEPAVGEIVAETMNNYLMGKRLIKAAYIPPEKQRRAFRKKWNAQNNPASKARLEQKKKHNEDKDEAGELKRARRLLSNLNNFYQKANALGINYDFFKPVDVPEALLDQVVKQEENDDTAKVETNKLKRKNDKKATKNEQKVQNGVQKEPEKKNNKKEKQNQVDKKETKEVIPVIAKKEKPVAKVNQKQQNEKEQKLKDAGVKPPQFIKVGEDSDGDDSSYDFDSDEYEKVLEKDDSDLSDESDDGDESNDDDEGSESDDDSKEEDEEPVPAKKAKGKPPPQVTQQVVTNNKKQGKNKQQPQKQQQKPQQQQQKQQQNQKQQQKQQQNKKQQQQQQQNNKQQKAQKQQPPATIVGTNKNSPQKSKKFEKQSQKPMKKQFKKK